MGPFQKPLPPITAHRCSISHSSMFEDRPAEEVWARVFATPLSSSSVLLDTVGSSLSSPLCIFYHSFKATSTQERKLSTESEFSFANEQPNIFALRRRSKVRSASSIVYLNDPQPGVVRELYPWTAMCVRNVDVHVSCSSQVDAQLAAFFIDPRAK